MKRIIYLLVLFIVSPGFLNAQKKAGSALELEGYKFDTRIKGPKHKNSKIIEVMIDENGYYLAATYKGPKSALTLIIYELYTWEIKGNYNFKSRAELYNSYFNEEGTYMYLNTDIYKNRYTGIDINTAEMKIYDCDETPKGCGFIEPKPYETSGYTAGENFLIFMDENRKNDLKVYRNKDMIMADAYLEEETFEEEPIQEKNIEEKVVGEVKTKEKVVEKPSIEELDIYLTEQEIEVIKKGVDVLKPGVKIMLKNDSNKKMMNKMEGDIRYVLLTLVDLSKLSFGNKIQQNHTTINLKN